MAETFPVPTYFIVVSFISRLKSSLGKSKSWGSGNFITPTSLLLQLDKAAFTLCNDPKSLEFASTDFGNVIRELPSAVLYPSSVNDIRSLIRLSYSSTVPFTIAARGNGHSVRGQAMAENGVVVDMSCLKSDGGKGVVVSTGGDASLGFYADVSGGQLWIDVLLAALEYGLSPVSWTDYLYITVGGTLSNAGIGGQTFRHGPQISNVYEMDVVTGKGDLITCSAKENSDLFHVVLGGLGQFGIIVRARIALAPAPKRVKWVRMLYSNFNEFASDQERLISINGGKEKAAPDYLEGLLLMHHGPPDNWRSSFFPTSDHSRIISLVSQHKIIYCIEVAKYYDDSTKNTVDKELDLLFSGMNFIPGFKFERDVSYADFLNRVRSGELKLQSQGLWNVPHPWLNLFVPKSRISDFNSGVFKDIVLRRNITKGPVLIYPMNKNRWDDRMSAVTPDEEVFYSVGFLHSSGFDDWKALDDQNKEILQFCDDAGIKIKQYLPHFETQEGWAKHFGSMWRKIRERKSQYDPAMILSPGQRIFNS